MMNNDWDKLFDRVKSSYETKRKYPVKIPKPTAQERWFELDILGLTRLLDNIYRMVERDTTDNPTIKKIKNLMESAVTLG